jgi:hypothetical protein
VAPPVQVERATVRTTWTPGAASARLARVDGRRDGSPAPSHDERTDAGRAPSIPEPERPRRRHRLDLGCVVSSHALELPLVGARGVGRAERGGDRSDGAAGRRTRARRSGSGAGSLEPVEKVVTRAIGPLVCSVAYGLGSSRRSVTVVAGPEPARSSWAGSCAGSGFLGPSVLQRRRLSFL